MRKTFLLFIALMMCVATSFAQSNGGDGSQPLPFKIIKTGTEHNPLPKSPIQIPEVYLTGNALSFDAAIEGCEVRLLNENKNVVFTDFIEENQTILNFPSTLTGTFELRIIQGNIIFYCEIEL